MAELVIQTIDREGGITQAAAAVAGDTFQGHPGNVVFVTNADGAVTRTITIAAVNDPLSTPQAGNVDLPDIAIVVGISSSDLFHVPPAYVSAGVVSMTYDDESDLTIGVGVLG